MGKEHITGRIDKHIKNTVLYICSQSKLNVSLFIELACIELINKWDKDLKYEGIDFKEYAKDVKFSRLRRIVGKARNEFLSGTLISARINVDIYKIILIKKDKSKLKNLITHYLELRKKEALFYRDSKEILKEIEELEKRYEGTKLTDFRKYLQDKVSHIEYLQQISKNE